MTRSGTTTRARVLIAVVAIVALAGTAVIYDRLFRAADAPYFESDEEHFLYGSIGAEAREGIPYWVWLVLPRVFPDLLPTPGGYAALGLLSQDGREMPIGLTKVTIGYPRVAVNCALCHTASVRSSPDDLPRIVVGAPAHQAGAHEYRRFLAAAAADPRFTASNILAEISRNYRLSFVDRLLYRFVVIPGTRRQLRQLAEGSTPTADDGDWGRGRADLFTLLKVRKLGLPGNTPGTADTVPLWRLDARAERGLFWDGLHTSLRDALVSSALSEGSARPWLDREIDRWDRTDPREMSSLRRIQNYISTLEPPPYPLPVDAALAAAGATVYRSECAQCHAPGGSPRAGDVVAVSEVGTDPRRAEIWTTAANSAYGAYAARREWASTFRTTGGYVAVPLDGLWLRAPYLHNGSVPSLADLLEPASRRPMRFWRGYDVFDPVKVGFIADGPEAQASGTVFETSRPGNGNGGHEYGVALTADDKRALIEYLKTL
jgi:hypothetical protein